MCGIKGLYLIKDFLNGIFVTFSKCDLKVIYQLTHQLDFFIKAVTASEERLLDFSCTVGKAFP